MNQQTEMFQPSSYQNTVPESGQQLEDYRMKADGQDRLILSFLKSHKYSSFTPREVWDRFKHLDWDLNSVRRCLTSYTKGYNDLPKLLIQTGEKRKGPKGRSENTWKWKV
jgi:hypothetical protein